MTDFGTITLEQGAHAIRFERVLAFPPEEVWSALTEPRLLREWLAEARVTPGLGGEITLDFGEGGRESGRISEWDPPRSLAYDWNFVGEEPSHVRFALAPVDGGAATRLTLEHTRLVPDSAADYGAGWHAHLDQLQGHLEGSVPSWEARFEELRGRYAELARATA